jgi:hypothetical protein
MKVLILFRIAGHSQFLHQFVENKPIIPGGRALTEQHESGSFTRRPGYNRFNGATVEVTALLT